MERFFVVFFFFAWQTRTPLHAPRCQTQWQRGGGWATPSLQTLLTSCLSWIHMRTHALYLCYQGAPYHFEESQIWVLSVWQNHVTELAREMAVVILNRNYDCLCLDKTVKWKERKTKNWFDQTWRHPNRTWFIPSSAFVCTSLEMMDNGVAKKERFSPEDTCASENQGRQKAHSSWHYWGQAGSDL